MNKIQAQMGDVKTTKPLALAIGILVVTGAAWLTFVLATWNQNLLVTVLALIIPAVLFRTLMGRKLFNAPDDLEMILLGVLLWNHMIVVIVLLFGLKVLVSKLRK